MGDIKKKFGRLAKTCTVMFNKKEDKDKLIDKFDENIQRVKTFIKDQNLSGIEEAAD